jgi:RHS repeat-associated protein
VNITGTGTTISSFAYRVDGVGNRQGVTESDGTRVTWSYDNTYQLTHEQRSGKNAYNVTYSYDAVGNRSTSLDSGARTTYAFDAANQVVTAKAGAGTTTYTFDANGNQAVTTAPAGGGRTTNTWDFENKLSKAILASGTRNTFQYNADGKRVQKVDSGGTANFVWDEQNVLQEADQTNTTQVTYTLEPLVYGNLISQRRGLVSSYYHFDGLGSTDRITDGTALVLNNYIYRAYGVSQLSVEAATNRYKYVGRQGYYSDPDTGQSYVRVRYYGPSTGRWLSQDPASSDRQGSPYRYAANAPVVSTDPSGTITVKTLDPNESVGKLQCGDEDSIPQKIMVEGDPCKGKKGYLIQYVEVWCISRWCRDCKCPSNLDMLVGALRLRKPDVFYWETSGLGRDAEDSSGIRCTAEKCGLIFARGTWKYFCEADAPGIDKWTEGEILYKGPAGTCNVKGGPMTTQTEPKFWKTKSVQGPTITEANSIFNCCFDPGVCVTSVIPRL